MWLHDADYVVRCRSQPGFNDCSLAVFKAQKKVGDLNLKFGEMQIDGTMRVMNFKHRRSGYSTYVHLESFHRLGKFSTGDTHAKGTNQWLPGWVKKLRRMNVSAAAVKRPVDGKSAKQKGTDRKKPKNSGGASKKSGSSLFESPCMALYAFMFFATRLAYSASKASGAIFKDDAPSCRELVTGLSNTMWRA